jgi:hypothetical protein
MRVHRRAAVFRIARQVCGVDAATGVELGVIDIDLFVESDLRADDTGAKRGTADDAIGCRLGGGDKARS